MLGECMQGSPLISLSVLWSWCQVSFLGDWVCYLIWLLHHTFPWCFLLLCLQAASPAFVFFTVHPSPHWVGHSLDLHVLFKSRLWNCLNVVWGRNHIILISETKKNISSLPTLRWNGAWRFLMASHWEKKTQKLVVAINERANVGSGLVPCHIIRSLAICPQSTLHLSFGIIYSLVIAQYLCPAWLQTCWR